MVDSKPPPASHATSDASRVLFETRQTATRVVRTLQSGGLLRLKSPGFRGVGASWQGARPRIWEYLRKLQPPPGGLLRSESSARSAGAGHSPVSRDRYPWNAVVRARRPRDRSCSSSMG